MSRFKLKIAIESWFNEKMSLLQGSKVIISLFPIRYKPNITQGILKSWSLYARIYASDFRTLKSYIMTLLMLFGSGV